MSQLVESYDIPDCGVDTEHVANASDKTLCRSLLNQPTLQIVALTQNMRLTLVTDTVSQLVESDDIPDCGIDTEHAANTSDKTLCRSLSNCAIYWWLSFLVLPKQKDSGLNPKWDMQFAVY